MPVELIPHADRVYEQFPDDPDLRVFDRSDRKFAAAVIESGDSPSVLNAVDTDWWIHRKALARNGVRVQVLCAESMERDQSRAGGGRRIRVR